jgi:hypothetical protein
MWANAESWLIRTLAVILGISPAKADVVFYTITSSRSRVELVQRAAIMFLRKPAQARHLMKLLREFGAVSRLRNQVCHAQYIVDSSGNALTYLLSTNYARSDFDGTNHEQERRIDKGLINEVTQARRKAVSLCGRLKRFVSRKPAVLRQPRDTPLQLRKSRKTK